MYDALIVGSGFAGSVAARELAEKGWKVLVMEKRSHTGGNCFDSPDATGVPVHLYGPHIFHTNSDIVYNYIIRFGAFKKYEHRVLGYIDGKFVPIPFNFKSAEILLGEKAEKIKGLLKEEYEGKEAVTVNALLKSENAEIKEFGEFIFGKVFLNYTSKQWGIPAYCVDRSVLDRVPVNLNYDDRYFKDKYQMMPETSYADVFANILNSKNITLATGKDALEDISLIGSDIYYKGAPFKGQVIYTGAVDALFDFVYGALPYRSAYMEFETINTNVFQPSAVVNYPNDYDFTRITEFKHFYGNKGGGKTTILKEYPEPYDLNGKGNIPYYVIPGKENVEKYQKYKNLAERYKNLHLIGRLAEYKYYNMDAVILRALEKVKEITMENQKQ
jgi:UDP-galactopyranose mutase